MTCYIIEKSGIPLLTDSLTSVSQNLQIISNKGCTDFRASQKNVSMQDADTTY